MLTRAPEFYFKAEDEAVIAKETALNTAQISKWSENFRMRYETLKERMDFLSSDASEKVTWPPLILGTGTFSGSEPFGAC